MRFRDLRIGQTFDFIRPGGFNSFFLRCTKVSARQYRDETGTTHTVGTVKVEVYNVGQ